MVNLSRFAPVSEAHAEREGAGEIPSGARERSEGAESPLKTAPAQRPTAFALAC